MIGKLAIIGAGGHGKVVADAALTMEAWHEIIFFDDAVPAKKYCLGFPIVGGYDDIVSSKCKYDFIVAIGNNKVRLEKTRHLSSLGHTSVNVIHSSAIISRFVSLGTGTVFLAGSIVNADAQIGDSVIVNTNAIIEHDCKIMDGVHICPGAKLAGNVVVGESSWIGLGASVIQLKNIGKYVVVGAGSAVIKDLPDNVTAVGVPAKIIKS
jgi:sugar O-acyltransferase (sialic acid O-acetyltransferase NeuD family)